MKILVNNIDVSSSVIENSFELSYFGAFRSSFSFSMEVIGSGAVPEISAGMEIKLFGDSNELIWGGILESCVYIHRSVSLTGINLMCRGYEFVLSHRSTLPVSTVSETGTVRSVFKNIYDNYLEAEGLKWSDSNIAANMLTGYSTLKPMLISKLFDDISAYSNNCWWIDKNKYIHCKRSISVGSNGYSVNLDSTDTGGNLLNFLFYKKTGDYRNRQTVIGKDYIFATVSNNAEVLRMKNFFGSGRYDNVAENSRYINLWTVEASANEHLGIHDSEILNAEFTTTDSNIRQFDRISIKGSKYGLTEYKNFYVTELTVKRVNNVFVYKVSAKFSDSDSVSPTVTWMDILGKVF